MYLEINEPWKLLKQDSDSLIAATTLYISINALYTGTQLLHPIMPKKTLEISNMLGASDINIINEEFDILKPNKQCQRTFIISNQEERLHTLFKKFTIIDSETLQHKKKLILIDDSIVRGNTLVSVVSLLKKSLWDKSWAL